MNIRDYKFELREIERQIETTKRSSTAAIDQQTQLLREMQEQWSRDYVVPTINRLIAKREQIKRLIAMEKKSMAAKKSKKWPLVVQTWFDCYKKTHPGRILRWTDNTWVIVTHRLAGGGKRQHLGININTNEQILIAIGRLTSNALNVFLSRLGHKAG